MLGPQAPFATDTITVPFQNPYGTLFFVSGHDFFSDGSAAICTMTGEVWLVRGIDEKLEKLRWKRFATGLHQPLGLKIVKDKIYVLGRDHITCCMISMAMTKPTTTPSASASGCRGGIRNCGRQ